MLKDIQASLYDFFGYLFPGIVALTGVCVFGSTLEDPNVSTAFQTATASPSLIAASLFVSYCLGHIMSGLGNAKWFSRPKPEHILYGFDSSEDSIANRRWLTGVRLPELSEEWRQQAQKAFQAVYGLGDLETPPYQRGTFADEARLLLARDGERDVYLYREGFYRAMTLALVALGFSLLVRAIVGPMTLRLAPNQVFDVSRLPLSLLTVLSFSSVFVCYRRFHHFAATRASRALALLLLAARQVSGEKGKDTVVKPRVKGPIP